MRLLRQVVQARKHLVGASKPAVADDIGDQDRRELPGLAQLRLSWAKPN